MKIKNLTNKIKEEFDKEFNVIYMNEVCTGGLLTITFEIENNVSKKYVFNKIHKILNKTKYSKFLEIEEVHIHKDDIVISIQNNFNVEIDYINGYYFIQE